MVSNRNLPFTWTINPYRGCEFACKYCYARYTHEFMEMTDEDFEHKIFVKQHAADLLRQELRKVKHGRGNSHWHCDRSLSARRTPLRNHPRHPRGVRAPPWIRHRHCHQIKSVVRDAELLREIAQHNRLFVNLTITTVNTELARILEPRAPRPDLRLDAVRQLNLAGVPAGVICAPVLPGITDEPRDLEALVEAAAQAGAKYMFANPLFLKPCSASIFLPFLEKEFPHLVTSYRERYEQRAFLPPAFSKRLSPIDGAVACQARNSQSIRTLRAPRPSASFLRRRPNAALYSPEVRLSARSTRGM